MKRIVLMCLLLVGCASKGPYDQQFCTVMTDKGCKAWTIAPGLRK